MHAAIKIPTVLVVARTLQDAREVATNLGLRVWATEDDRLDGRIWSGIVYVDGWLASSAPARVVAEAVATARAGAETGYLELEQFSSAWFFAAETNARNAQAVLARERELAKPSAPLSVAPEALAATGEAYTLHRLPWWRSILRRR